MTEAAVPAVALTRCGRVVESEILHGDRVDVRCSSKADQPADRMTKLRIPVESGPGEVEWDAGWPTDRIAGSLHNPTGEVIGVEVDGEDPLATAFSSITGGAWEQFHEASRY